MEETSVLIVGGGLSGLSGAVFLAWRAAVLAGDGGEALLDGYDEERRPVAAFTRDQALLQMRDRTGLAARVSAEPAEYDAVVFGYRYRSALISTDAEGADGPPALAPRELTGVPGTRAPHVAIGGRSTLDLYGRRHVLLAGHAAREWAECARSIGVLLDVFQVGTDIAVDPVRFCSAHGISASGCLLVRPDGFVAWRSGDSRPSIELLHAVLARSLGTLPIFEHF